MFNFKSKVKANPEKVFDLAIAAAVACAYENGVGEHHIMREFSNRAAIITGRLEMARAARNITTPKIHCANI
jgi:hypothetical protein